LGTICRRQTISSLAANADAAGLRGLQRSLGPRRDQFSLVLGDGGENMPGQPR
jgi:hypothetical protein